MEGVNRSSTDGTPPPLMDGGPEHGVVVEPDTQSIPVVLASPHSGRNYPDDFFSISRLDPISLRKSEDCFVDEIFAAAAGLGAPMIKALFPRAYVDVNREPFELDPDMFADALPDYVNTHSPRVAAGLGTVARIVSHGKSIYRHKLRFEEVLSRIDRHYRPYHARLSDLVLCTKKRFGYCILIDCHSMPSSNPIPPRGPKRGRVDFVLGDAYGRACNPAITDLAEGSLSGMGFNVVRNFPYAGGYTTRHYGHPEASVHALQIEINRGLYMDETALSRKAYLTELSARMADLVARIAATDLNGEFSVSSARRRD